MMRKSQSTTSHAFPVSLSNFAEKDTKKHIKPPNTPAALEACRRAGVTVKEILFIPRGKFALNEIVEMKKRNEVIDEKIIDLRYEFAETRRREKLDEVFERYYHV